MSYKKEKELKVQQQKKLLKEMKNNTLATKSIKEIQKIESVLEYIKTHKNYNKLRIYKIRKIDIIQHRIMCNLISGTLQNKNVKAECINILEKMIKKR